MGGTKEISAIVRRMQRQGWRLEESGRHLKLFHPSGKRFVSISRTPSDRRAVVNITADIRRCERECSE